MIGYALYYCAILILKYRIGHCEVALITGITGVYHRTSTLPPHWAPPLCITPPFIIHSADLLRDLLDTQLDSVVGLEDKATGEARDGDAAAAAALEASAKAYEFVASFATSDYEGFVPPSSDWAPTRLEFAPTADLFETFIARREPVILSLGANLDESTCLRFVWSSQFIDVHSLTAPSPPLAPFSVRVVDIEVDG